MKIEKINKDNIKEFIGDMKLNNTNELELNINKIELYGVKKDDIFYLGFNNMSSVDTIAILYYNSKLTDELFYECISFLDRSLVVENHLLVEVYDKKYMKLFDEKYKCKGLCASYVLDGSKINNDAIYDNNTLLKEKILDIEMKSIKYYTSKSGVVCNLIKQNIQEEKVIIDLHSSFVNMDISYINFIIFPDSFEYFSSLGYECLSKIYVIRNDLF